MESKAKGALLKSNRGKTTKQGKQSKQNILNKNKYQIHTITDLFWKKKSTKLILIKQVPHNQNQDGKIARMRLFCT